MSNRARHSDHFLPKIAAHGKNNIPHKRHQVESVKPERAYLLQKKGKAKWSTYMRVRCRGALWENKKKKHKWESVDQQGRYCWSSEVPHRSSGGWSEAAGAGWRAWDSSWVRKVRHSESENAKRWAGLWRSQKNMGGPRGCETWRARGTRPLRSCLIVRSPSAMSRKWLLLPQELTIKSRGLSLKEPSVQISHFSNS